MRRAAECREVIVLDEFRRRHQSATLTLLFSDVVDSTRYKQVHGDPVGAADIQAHIARARGILAGFRRAQEIGTQGDSFFAAFASPSEAVRFALRFQAMMRSEFAPRGLSARVGIHLGEVVVAAAAEGREDLLGLQVDVAARLCALADGGRILCTRPVADNAKQFLRPGQGDADGWEALTWADHGRYRLKGVQEPVEVCEVLAGSGTRPRPPQGAGARNAGPLPARARRAVLMTIPLLMATLCHAPAPHPRPKPGVYQSEAPVPIAQQSLRPPELRVEAEHVETAAAPGSAPTGHGLLPGFGASFDGPGVTLPRIEPPRLRIPEVPKSRPPEAAPGPVERNEPPPKAVEAGPQGPPEAAAPAARRARPALPDWREASQRIRAAAFGSEPRALLRRASAWLRDRAAGSVAVPSLPVAGLAAARMLEPLWSVAGETVLPWDADGDGQEEALIGRGRSLTLVGGDGRELWTRRFTDAVHAGAVAGGRVVATVRYGAGFRVTLVDGRGRPVGETRLPWPGVFPGRPHREYGVSALGAADSDGDGRLEFELAVASRRPEGPNGRLVVEEGTGRVLSWEPSDHPVPPARLQEVAPGLAGRIPGEVVGRLRRNAGPEILAVGGGFVSAYRSEQR